MNLSQSEEPLRAAPFGTGVSAPADLALDTETFEDILDLEAALRLSLAGISLPGANAQQDIATYRARLEGRFPREIEAGLDAAFGRLDTARDSGEATALHDAQERLVEQLTRLRKSRG